MFITDVKLKNWKNFREANALLYSQTYLIGPNASGKSNFLDLFRFLRDVSKPSGGGLQKAVEDRGGISKLRCLHARGDNEVKLEISIAPSIDASAEWTYILGFKSEGVGRQRIQVTEETVIKNGKTVLRRPDKGDKSDKERLTQTHLEQISLNKNFRTIADYFAMTTYLHIVPQLLKYGDKIGGKALEEDPLGQKFLERIADSTERTRKSRLDKIENALKIAVPRFEGIRFVRDAKNGTPHLEALYVHHRPKAGWQREDQFSDGTLRLIGLLWMLLDGDSLLLMEEPELSLHNAIVERIPELIMRIQRQAKHKRQIIISTHSEALLRNKGIDSRAVLLLKPDKEGTKIRPPNDDELATVDTGFSVAEVMLPKIKPQNIEQLGLF